MNTDKPKKMGRPKLAKSKARSQFVSTRLSPDEYSDVTKAIRRDHKDKTEWVRDALLEKARRIAPAS